VLSGSGPVVLLDARGMEWSVTVSELERRGGRPERLVVVTDQPVMHLARELPTMVEYLPSDTDRIEPGFADKRLAELRRLYAVTIYVRLEPDTQVRLP
jgi:hypothetical protein